MKHIKNMYINFFIIEALAIKIDLYLEMTYQNQGYQLIFLYP